jgi:hypothetical protein
LDWTGGSRGVGLHGEKSSGEVHSAVDRQPNT